MRVLVVLMLTAIAFAGCADSGNAPEPVPADDVVVPEVTAGAGLGKIVGVVVDEAVRPIVGATVTVTPGDLVTETDENGAFGFGDMEPGTYFVNVEKLGYDTIQQGVEVVADVEPSVLKVLLTANIEEMPYYQVITWDGFIECSTTVLAVCSVPNDVTDLAGQPPLTNDEFINVHELDGPDALHLQTEMIWDTTQALSDRMWLWHSYGNGDSGFSGSFHHTTGASPLLIETNREMVEANAEGGGVTIEDWNLVLRIFSGDIEGTTPPMCVLFCNGPGFAIQQEFQTVTHVFYNYAPPEEWRFTSGTEVPTP